MKLDGDRVVVRTNHLSFHLKDEADRQAHFDAGIVHRFDAVRTPGGWRLSRGEASVVWTNGGWAADRGEAGTVSARPRHRWSTITMA